MVPARLREVIELVLVGIHAAGGDFVQERLPQVRARAVDERDHRALPAPERVAEPGCELEPAGAAADDHYVVHTRCVCQAVNLTRAMLACQTPCDL